MTTQNKITFRVIDAPTGAGKTTALIKMINAAQPAADNFNRFFGTHSTTFRSTADMCQYKL